MSADKDNGKVTVPPKIRELVSELQRAGFFNRGGRGSHRNFIHPGARVKITLSGNAGADARAYQIKMVLDAIERSK